MVDARDLKSLGATPRAGSSPAPGTNKNNGLYINLEISMANPLVLRYTYGTPSLRFLSVP